MVRRYVAKSYSSIVEERAWSVVRDVADKCVHAKLRAYATLNDPFHAPSTFVLALFSTHPTKVR